MKAGEFFLKAKSAGGVARGALFLTLAGVLVKIIGMIYKIPLTNRLGEDGMGYFNAAYTVYTFFFVLSSSGLPTALSLSVAKDLAGGREGLARKRFFVMRRFCFFLGTSLCLLLLFLAKPFSLLLGSPKAYLSLLAVSPSIVFVTLASVYRGYHQGRGNMLPTALSQSLEALGKLTFGLLLLSFAISHGFSKEKIAACAILGLSLATFFSYAFLALLGRGEGRASPLFWEQRRALTRDTLTTAMPITLSALATTLVTSLDLVLLMRALQKIGYSPDAANAAWGNYSALVLPLFHMPQILITPIAASALPALRSAVARGDSEKRRALVVSCVVLTALLSALAALGLSLFARDALSLIYTDDAAIARAYPHLALVAIAVFPFGLLSVSASLLQAHGKLWLPTLSLFLGAVVKLLFTVFGVSAFGEAVSPFGTLLSYTLSAAINFAALVKYADVKLLRHAVLLPFAIASLSVTAGLFVKYGLGTLSLDCRLATLIAIACSGAAALFLTYLSGIGKSEAMQVLFNKTKSAMSREYKG